MPLIGPAPHSSDLQQEDPKEPDGLKKIFGPLAIAALLILKLFGKLKFIALPLLKSGGSMLLMIGVYATTWGWRWAVGFALLLLVHECGHLLVAKKFGLKVGAPVFIPFMGAFIALKEAPRNAWIEACVGIGGPLLGSAASFVCHEIGYAFDLPLFIGLAWTGYFLNLFNLAPVGFLDGGRIATALSPWLWLPGFALLGWIGWKFPNPIVWLVLVVSLPRLFSLFRKRTEEEQRYFEVTPAQRWQMAGVYLGLIVALVFGMHEARQNLAARDERLQAVETELLLKEKEGFHRWSEPVAVWISADSFFPMPVPNANLPDAIPVGIELQAAR